MDPFEVPENIMTICRVCRSARGVMSYIFSCSGVDDSSPLSSRIMSFANVQMNEGDGLPSLICHRCLYHIEKLCEFKELCEQSDALLRQHLHYQEGLETGKDSMGPPYLNGISNGFVNRKENFTSVKEEPSEETSQDMCDQQDGTEEEDEEEEEDEGFNCPTCSKKFDSQEKVDRHVMIHSQDGPFPCDFCDREEIDKASLRVHWKEHAGPYSTVCQTCGDSFESKEAFLEHNLRHDRVKPFHCQVCQKAFSYRSDLRKHSIIHTGLRPYVCRICDKSFTRSTNLNKHARLHAGMRPFCCVHCNKMFSSRGDLVRHTVIHTGVKPFTCSMCSISFNRRDKLTRHEKIHLRGRAHSCSECPTSFNRKEELTKHYQFHHYSSGMFYGVEAAIHPDVAIFKTENNEAPNLAGDGTEDLIINVDPSHWSGGQLSTPRTVGTHEPDRPFACDICPKRFRQRRELRRHVFVHSGTKPYSCSTCGKAFIRSDKLRRHQLIHNKPDLWEVKVTALTSHPCPVCGIVMPTSLDLRRHKLTHTMEEVKEEEVRDYKCIHCSKTFSKKGQLSKHIKLDHSETLRSDLINTLIDNPEISVTQIVKP